MPLWDSVHRSLEKASHEAARIAKTQRLRNTIDGLNRQINTQQNSIVNKAMDMFVAGQLTTGELFQLCQEMMNLQQQLNQARNELQQIQIQAPTPTPPSQISEGQGGTVLNASGEGIQPTAYAPPPEYSSYLDSTSAVDVPPPPPGAEALTISAMETVEMNRASSSPKQFCSVCHAELFPNNAFCQSCGAPVQVYDSQHSPTVRAGNTGQSYTADEATVRAEEPKVPSPPSSSPPQAYQTTEEPAQNEGV
ncbi:MAG: hypothetical protein NVSMB27_48570 [Ktedonobacteraceae bacterium]